MNKIIFIIALCGLAFSGYLGGVKLFLGTCAFNESCPYFLGYPACFFGFFMYLIITIGAAAYLFGSEQCQKRGVRIVRWTALVGILFAGYFTLRELPLLFEQGLKAYVLGLPTCALGLVMYMALFFLTTRVQGRVKEEKIESL